MLTNTKMTRGTVQTRHVVVQMTGGCIDVDMA
jgi:hypothetical protein